MSEQNPPPSPNQLVRLWTYLTTPHPAVPQDERQKASILMAMLTVFTPLAALVVFSGPISVLLTGTGNATPTPPAVIALIIVLVAYQVSRTRHYQWAGYLVVFTPILAVGGVIVNLTSAPTPTALFFLTLSVIFSGLLFDAKRTFVVGVIGVAMSIGAYAWPVPDPTPVIWPIPMFIAISTAVMAVVSELSRGYVISLEKTQRQLREQYTVAEEARERAERSDQVKSAFLASMSHELRTPLNAIINFTKFVSKGTMGPVTPQQVEMLDEVIDSAKHLLNLINDVLDMSKIEAGSLTLFIEDNVDLKAILTSALNTGRALAKDKTLTFNVLMAEDLPTLRGDRQRILQALLNVLSNAVKFTDAGNVTVKAKRGTEEDVVLEVSDTGPGIAPEDQAGVFEAFKQTTTGLRQVGGTGLGMPITKSLVEAHGGRIWLTSATGQGTTFYISLPIKSDKLVPMTNI
jgi:signal transduction histidine kinase